MVASIDTLPKAELHAHLEDSISPDIIRKLAERNKVKLPDHIIGPDNDFIYTDFLDFLRVTDVVNECIRTEQDYYEITYHYLQQAARQGVIYQEIMPSPDHARVAGLSYKAMLDAVADAVHAAHKDFGITACIWITCVRQFGIEACTRVAEDIVANPHPLVRGFGMAGDEAGFPPKQFAKVFHIARDAGLLCTVHAGEHTGPEGIWDAIDGLPVCRIGHGVRAIEDAKLVATLVERNIALEVCPCSNVKLKVYPDFASHPLKALLDAGVKVTLNADDPPFFSTSIGNEYQVAHDAFGLDVATLLEITRNAINAGFIEPAKKAQLLAQVDAYHENGTADTVA